MLPPNYKYNCTLSALYVFFKTDFRFYWLHTKLQEESMVSQVSTDNSVSIILHAHNLSEVHVNVAINKLLQITQLYVARALIL